MDFYLCIVRKIDCDISRKRFNKCLQFVQRNQRAMFFSVLILFLIKSAVCDEKALLCDDILNYPDEKMYTIEELKSMAEEEVDKCLLQLGKSKMSLESAKIIWTTLTDHYEGVSNIPEEKLMVLHWITIALEPEDYENITLASIDVIENFGLFYDLTEDQLNALTNRIREDFKTPQDFSSYDLMALKQILCAFNSSEIDSIHPEAYRDAASSLATLQRCPRPILEALARLAVDEKAYGPVDKWVESTITAVGIVIDGLPPNNLTTMPKDLIQFYRNSQNAS